MAAGAHDAREQAGAIVYFALPVARLRETAPLVAKLIISYLNSVARMRLSSNSSRRSRYSCSSTFSTRALGRNRDHHQPPVDARGARRRRAGLVDQVREVQDGEADRADAGGALRPGTNLARSRPLLPVPPAKPKGSKLKKWTCPRGVNVRVAIAEFDRNLQQVRWTVRARPVSILPVRAARTSRSRRDEL
jgi:hypothetical protein